MNVAQMDLSHRLIPVVLEGESNILLVVPKSRLDAVLTNMSKLMKRGHHLVAFGPDTQVLRRERFDE